MKKKDYKEELRLKEESSAYKIEEKSYTYQDILDWKETKLRYEIIDGELFVMESPKPKHQLYLGEIHRQIANYLYGKTCLAFMAPSDVKLAVDFNKKLKEVYKNIKDYVQPDIYVICDRDKLDATGILGIPDMVIEILSPSNKQHDLIKKFNLYQKYLVKEYWIVDTEEEKIFVYVLNNKNIYELKGKYDITDNIKVNIFEDLEISLKNFKENNKEILKKL